MPSPAVVAENLRKRYGETIALNGLDLTVEHGTVHGMLGPNGAGKTTAVRILTTLLRPDEGRATVAGHDIRTHATEVRRCIGLVGQHAAVDELLSGRQNLVMFGRLYHLTRKDARQRADELLERFRLADTGRKPAKDYSGGMRRRLDLAAGLILAPKVLFLDEPTTGLDPRGRNEVWEAIRELKRQGTTVVLTTQYLEEADQLADRISVIDHGKVIAEGTPDALKRQIGADRVDLVVRHADDLDKAATLLARITHTETATEREQRRVSAPVVDRMETLAQLMPALTSVGIEAEDVVLRRPTLDEVFLHLTESGKEAA